MANDQNGAPQRPANLPPPNDAWGLQAGGYRFNLPVLPALPQQGGQQVAQQQAVQQQAVPQQAVQRPRVNPLNVDVSTISMSRSLKGDANKKTCLMDLNGTSYVVKGGTEQSAHHIEATAFMGQLGMRGVRVPAVRTLTPAENQTIIDRMNPNNADAMQLANALAIQGANGASTGQISELVNGAMVNESLTRSRSQVAEIEQEIAARQPLLAKTRDEAWKASFEELASYSKKVQAANQADIARYTNATTAQDRQAALDWMTAQGLGTPNMSGVMRGALMKARLSDLHADQFQQGTTAVEQGEVARKAAALPLLTFAKSDEGVEAFAGMAVGDLLAGMDDRVLSKWNPENFLFDPAAQELCCIDNQKEPNMAVSAADPTRWKQFISNNMKGMASLEEMVFNKVYEKTSANGTSTSALHQHLAFTDTEKAAALVIIRRVVNEAMDKVRDDPAQGAPVKARVAVMRAQQSIGDLLNLPNNLVSPPPRPVKIGKGEKAERMVGSGINRLMSLRDSGQKDYRAKTQAIKNGLRDGSLAPQKAQADLLALQKLQGPQGALAGDRRSTKIMFVAKGLAFAANLETVKASLLTALRRFPDDAMVDETRSALAAKLRDSVANWRQVYENEDSVANKLTATWNEFPQAFRQ